MLFSVINARQFKFIKVTILELFLGISQLEPKNKSSSCLIASVNATGRDESGDDYGEESSLPKQRSEVKDRPSSVYKRTFKDISELDQMQKDCLKKDSSILMLIHHALI